MTTTLINSNYNGLNIAFSNDAWFNATLAAERFGKRVDHWLKTQETQQYIDVLCSVSNTPKKGYLKTKRGNNGGTWLHPALAVLFARWLDIRFSIWCDTQIRQILTASHPHHEWQYSRHEAMSSFKVMTAALQDYRSTQNKVTEAKHFTAEVRLVAWALTGSFNKLDRETLNKQDLALLAKIEIHNAVLISQGLAYEQRKPTLKAYADELKSKFLLVQVA